MKEVSLKDFDILSEQDKAEATALLARYDQLDKQDSYQNDLRGYQYEVERFIDDLQDYLREAQDYVNCEIRSLN